MRKDARHYWPLAKLNLNHTMHGTVHTHQKAKNTTMSSIWVNRKSNTFLEGRQNIQVTFLKSLAVFFFFFLLKLTIHLPYSITILILGVYPRTMKTQHKDLCTNILSNLLALLIIFKKLKQPKYLSINEWINKVWQMCTME